MYGELCRRDKNVAEVHHLFQFGTNKGFASRLNELKQVPNIHPSLEEEDASVSLLVYNFPLEAFLPSSVFTAHW